MYSETIKVKKEHLHIGEVGKGIGKERIKVASLTRRCFFMFKKFSKKEKKD